jgi:hypothetical protein
LLIGGIKILPNLPRCAYALAEGLVASCEPLEIEVLTAQGGKYLFPQLRQFDCCLLTLSNFFLLHKALPEASETEATHHGKFAC